MEGACHFTDSVSELFFFTLFVNDTFSSQISSTKQSRPKKKKKRVGFDGNRAMDMLYHTCPYMQHVSMWIR